MQRRTFLHLAAAGAASSAFAASNAFAACDRGVESVAKPTDAAAFAAARRFAQTPFGRIAYVERGRGDAALFLHGFPLNGFQWRGALDRLASHRRCVVPDFLG